MALLLYKGLFFCIANLCLILAITVVINIVGVTIAIASRYAIQVA